MEWVRKGSFRALKLIRVPGTSESLAQGELDNLGKSFGLIGGSFSYNLLKTKQEWGKDGARESKKLSRRGKIVVYYMV